MARHDLKGLVAVDLFSGCGGLTVGLKRAGFRVVSAVELDARAAATYSANHTEVAVHVGDIRDITATSLATPGQVAVVAGCPPCQGFSTLTSQWRRSDPRDGLVREMGRVVEELAPEVVMMENVPGLATKGKPYFDDFVSRIKDQGYLVTWDVLQVADYGVPQRRKRLVLLAGKEFRIDLPTATHHRSGANGLLPWRTVAETISHLPEPVTLEQSHARGGPVAAEWHVVRRISDANRLRLRHARPGRTWIDIPEDLRPECHQQEQLIFRNSYGRMAWDEPASTITSGCTTPSKGRFGHPAAERTISVREAALLQTFPPDYRFTSPYIDATCGMIGNALPCEFAAVVASACAVALETHRTMQATPRGSNRSAPGGTRPRAAKRPAKTASSRCS